MRDIRHDLSERLRLLNDERKELEAGLAANESSRQALIRLLANEQQRFGDDEPTPGLNGASKTPKVFDVVMELLGSGEEWNTQMITKIAHSRGCDFQGKAPGRVVHSVLMGLSKSRAVNYLGASKWKKDEKLGSEIQ